MKKILFIIIGMFCITISGGCSTSSVGFTKMSSDDVLATSGMLNQAQDKLFSYQQPQINNYAYTEGENLYGNTLETIGYLYRRIVSNGEYYFGGIDYLFRCNLNGSDKQIIYDQPIGQVSFYDGWIYFSDCNYWSRFFDSVRLYRIRSDGSELEIIYDCLDDEFGTFMDFQIVNDRIYMNSSYRITETVGDRFGIQSMNLEGNDIIQICSYPASLITVDERVYFSHNNKIYNSDLDGANKQILFDSSGMWRLTIVDGYLYYFLNSDKSFYRTPLTEWSPEVLIKSVSSNPNYMFVKDGYLYFDYSYHFETEDTTIIRYNLVRTSINGNGEEEFICADITRMKYTDITPVVIGDWIFYQGNGYGVGDPFGKVKLDGSENTPISDWFY